VNAYKNTRENFKKYLQSFSQKNSHSQSATLNKLRGFYLKEQFIESYHNDKVRELRRMIRNKNKTDAGFDCSTDSLRSESDLSLSETSEDHYTDAASSNGTK